jgi:methyl-accepting chemotaxis protein
MEEKKRLGKEPISKDSIFKMMVTISFVVSGVFLIKNILSQNILATIIIGIMLLLFIAIITVTRLLHVKDELRQFLVCISLLFVVFIISLYSGSHYSDDFLLYLSIVGLTGLYMRPRYTLIQTIISDILLLLQYLIFPEKAESLSQYMMCIAVFTLASCLFYQTIKRGRAFIERSEIRAEEAEQLLNTMTTIGLELQKNFESSNERVADLKNANNCMEVNANELETGSSLIAQGAREIALFCGDVQNKIQVTEAQIDALNTGVKSFEHTLSVNRTNIKEMNHQMNSVKQTVSEANDVFRILNEQMDDITHVTEQLNSISSSTNMLSLNASIEAARAGKMGAGFAIVASKVQDLAVDSTKCSSEVDAVVGQMQQQIQKTTQQLCNSVQAIDHSLESLNELQSSFDRLIEQFDSLYTNIEDQNTNVTRVDAIFEQLKDKIMEMSSYSEENQSAVESIAEAMHVYKNNIKEVLDDTEQVRQLSSTMLNISQNKN